MKKATFKGIITAHTEYTELSSYRVYEIDGEDYVSLKGVMTAKGLQHWFYKISDLTIIDGIIDFTKNRPAPSFRLYKSQVEGVDFHSPIEVSEPAYKVES